MKFIVKVLQPTKNEKKGMVIIYEENRESNRLCHSPYMHMHMSRTNIKTPTPAKRNGCIRSFTADVGQTRNYL